MNIGGTEAIGFGDDAIHQLDDSRGRSETFVVVVFLTFNFDATLLLQRSKHIVEPGFDVLFFTATQIIDDVLGQAHSKHIVTGVNDALNLHDALVIGGVVYEDDCLFLITGNRQPEIAAQIADPDVFQ